MSLGLIGNASVVPQAATSVGEEKNANSVNSHIKTIYGDDNKKNILSAHMNRMSEFYKTVGSRIGSVNPSIGG